MTGELKAGPGAAALSHAARRSKPVAASSLRADVVEQIAMYMQRHLFAATPIWPKRFPVHWPERAQMQQRAAAILQADAKLRDWADSRGLTIVEKARNFAFTSVPLVSHVEVPDEVSALGIVPRELREAREQAVARAHRVEEVLRVVRDETVMSQPAAELAMRIVKMSAEESEVDSALLESAIVWFAKNLDCARGMTAREVPLPGFSAKWLGSASSSRRRAICLALGIEGLELCERPEELRYRYLDPTAAGWAERIATSRQGEPELPVTRAIIVENKDTYLALPQMAGTIAVFGSGYAACKRVASVLPWLDNPSVDVLYWGDIDADGFEILSGLRVSGIDCASVLMDIDTYRKYERFGTAKDARSKPIPPRVPKAGLCLTADEYTLYRQLCEGTLPVPRLEQERIPLEELHKHV